MPYIQTDWRQIVDYRIGIITAEIRDTADRHKVQRTTQCTHALVSFCQAFTRRSFDHMSKVQMLAKQVSTTFTPDEQEGVLNYVFTRIVVGTHIASSPMRFRDWTYRDIARVVRTFQRTLRRVEETCDELIISALECAKLEFYSRVAIPKERAARLANGDIPEYTEPDVFP